MKRFYTLFVILFTLSTLIHIGHTQDRDPEIVPDTDVDSPGVSITAPSAVQNGAFSATITFTEAVSDFVQADLSLSGTATANITNWNANTENTDYTATITPTTSGTVILNVAANVATDAANNPNTAAETKTVNVDVDRPTVTIGAPSGTQTGAFEATITFSETVSDFVQSDVVLTGAAASITTWNANNNIIGVKEAVSDFVQADPSLSDIVTALTQTVYTATITPTASGTVTINVAANVATDAANNPNTAAETKTVNVDVDRPTVTIDVPSGTQTGAFEATITFSETVSDFVQSDVVLTGAAASITTWSANTDKTVYTATITPTTSGTVILNVAANVATNAANKPNTAATAKTVNVDVDKPTVTIGVPSGTQTGAFEATITFSEIVSGFTQSDVALTGAAASITTWSANNNIIGFGPADPSLSNTLTVVTQTVCTATITPTASGTVTINVAANVATDAANNPNTAAETKTVNVDVDRPTVSIGVPSGTQTGAFETTITFSETVSDFVQSDVALTGSAASITGWKSNSNSTIYTATITPTASGTVTINVAANVATDAANNPNTAATAKNVTVSLNTKPPRDTNAPSVSITAPSAVQNGAFSVTITFTETVSGFTQSDLSLSGTATASITNWNANTEDTTYTATITPTTSGTVILNVAANVAKDAANNPNTAATAKTVNVDVDRPTVTIDVPSGTQTSAFTATITFSETVSGFAQSDVALTGSAASITGWESNSNSTIYTATITPTASGTVTINVAANVATDAANNPNTAATAKNVTVSDVAENRAPVFTNNNTTRSVAENTPSGQNIGAAVSATDPDEDTLTYSLEGTDAASFSIISASGQLQTSASLDYEIKSSYSVTVKVTDDSGASNNSATISVTISVTNANDAPEFDEGSTTTRSVDKGTYPLQDLGDPVSATDADGDTLIYTVGGTDAALFEIDGTNGQLSNKDFLSYEDKTSYSVTITVSDSKGGTDSITVAITDDKSPVVEILTYIRQDVPPWVLELDSETGIVCAVIPKTYTRYQATDLHMVSFTRPPGVKFDNSFVVAINSDEEVSGLEQTDLTLTENTAGANVTSWEVLTGGSHTNTVNTHRAKVEVTESGKVTFNVAAGVTSDDAGNSNAAPESRTVTVTITLTDYPPWDVNEDGSVDATDSALVTAAIGQTGEDIVDERTDVNWDDTVDADDVTLVTYHIENEGGAPSIGGVLSFLDQKTIEKLDPVAIQTQLDILRTKSNGSLEYLRAIALLESVLATIRPDKTRLLANYPNPFNPETWIPYHLANPSNVQITIYNTRGIIIRHLDIGHQQAGYYINWSRAAYWDGTNAIGERVATGIYFYTLTAGDFSATRKLLILK